MRSKSAMQRESDGDERADVHVRPRLLPCGHAAIAERAQCHGERRIGERRLRCVRQVGDGVGGEHVEHAAGRLSEVACAGHGDFDVPGAKVGQEAERWALRVDDDRRGVRPAFGKPVDRPHGAVLVR